jgi:flagellar motor protein MotB
MEMIVNADGLVIAGYADDSADSASNFALSQARAAAVRDYLVIQGVELQRIRVVAYGDTRSSEQVTGRRVALFVAFDHAPRDPLL